MAKFLDLDGVKTLWSKIKSYVTGATEPLSTDIQDISRNIEDINGTLESTTKEITEIQNSIGDLKEDMSGVSGNYVTLDTNQKITGIKTFNKGINLVDEGVTFPFLGIDFFNRYRLTVEGGVFGLFDYYKQDSPHIGIDASGNIVMYANNGNATGGNITLHGDKVLANKYAVFSGKSTQFLKADGSLDSNRYLELNSRGEVDYGLTISGSSSEPASLYFNNNGIQEGSISIVDEKLIFDTKGKPYDVWHSGNLNPEDFLSINGGDLKGALTVQDELYVYCDTNPYLKLMDSNDLSCNTALLYDTDAKRTELRNNKSGSSFRILDGGTFELNAPTNSADTMLDFCYGDAYKANVVYAPDAGFYIRNYVSNKAICLGDDGSFTYGNKEIWHKGNLDPDNYLPTTGRLSYTNNLPLVIDNNKNGSTLIVFKYSGKQIGYVGVSASESTTILGNYESDSRILINSNGIYYSVWNDEYYDYYKIWHEGNDGSGSGLDADLLDGKHANEFLLLKNAFIPEVNKDGVINSGLASGVGLGYMNGEMVILNDATTSKAGSMSADDKKKLDGLPKSWVGTQTEYNAITTKDNNTLYFIKES